MTSPPTTSCEERSDCAACCDSPDDVLWGRVPGATPPLRAWLPAGVFALVALTLVLVVSLVVRGPGPLDDPSPAEQRDALLLDGPRLPPEVAGLRLGSQVTVVLFERSRPRGPGYEQWREDVVRDGVRLVVVLAGAPQSHTLAEALHMPVPRDAGPPIGYAVVDASRAVRYATLDPSYLKNTFEVRVITQAVR